MEINRDKFQDLVNAIFADFPDEERKKIRIEGDGWTGHMAAWINLPESMFCRTVSCCRSDSYDPRTGAALVLSKLRESVLSERNRRRKKNRFRPWIPEDGQPYYTVEQHGDHYAIAQKCWIQNKKAIAGANLINLRNGIVFRTEREARKYVRTKELEGRAMINYWRKYASGKE